MSTNPPPLDFKVKISQKVPCILEKNQFRHFFASKKGERTILTYDIFRCFREKLRRFYEENGPVLLPKEVVLKDRLDANSRHELLLYRFVCF